MTDTLDLDQVEQIEDIDLNTGIFGIEKILSENYKFSKDKIVLFFSAVLADEEEFNKNTFYRSMFTRHDLDKYRDAIRAEFTSKSPKVTESMVRDFVDQSDSPFKDFMVIPQEDLSELDFANGVSGLANSLIEKKSFTPGQVLILFRIVLTQSEDLAQEQIRFLEEHKLEKVLETIRRKSRNPGLLSMEEFSKYMKKAL